MAEDATAESTEVIGVKERIYILVFCPVGSNRPHRAILRAKSSEAAWDILEQDQRSQGHKYIMHTAEFSFTTDELTNVKYFI